MAHGFHLFLFLSFYFTNVIAPDGCGYHEIKCGDMCVDIRNKGYCYCMNKGKNTKIGYNGGQWCCHSNECKVKEYDRFHGGVKIVECNGTTLDLHEQGPNKDKNTPTCNHYA